MSDIFNTDDFKQNIISEFSNFQEQLNVLVQGFGGSIQDYIRNTGSNAYDIGINLQGITEFISSNFTELNKSVSEIFDTTSVIQKLTTDFNSFHDLTLKSNKSDVSEHDRNTIMLACMSIVLLKNKCCQINKEIIVLLKSMCKYPEVNLLLKVTEDSVNR